MVMGRSVVPSGGHRWISFGLLGPHARTVTHRAGGRDAADAVLRPLGAYLVVLAGSAPGAPGGQSGSAFGRGQLGTPPA